jgi:Uncharacterized protein conserved in bacteria (DUF2059)
VRRRRPLLALAIVLAVATPALAQPYRWVDDRGNVHYSDRPPESPPPSLENMNPAARYRRMNTARERPEPAPPAARPPAPSVASPAPAPPGRPMPTVAPPPAAALPPRGTPPTAARLLEAGPMATDDADIVSEIMARAGMDRWLEYLVTLSRTEFGRLRWSLGDPGPAWTALMRGFERKELARPAGECLRRGLPSDDRTAVLTWLRTPLADKAVHLRDDAISPERRADYLDFVSRLADSPPPASRLALLQALERESRAAAFQVEVQRGVRQAVADALRPLLPPGARAGEVDEDRLDAHEEQMRFYSVSMMLFGYRDLSEAELDQIVRFAGSPVGSRFRQLSQECVRAALTAAQQRAEAAIRPLAAARR